MFDAARRRHFPAARNLIPAHLTLFHHLPADQGEAIAAMLGRLAERTSQFPLAVTGLRFLGYGSAYVVESRDLARLRAELAAEWHDHLTPQDAQAFRPHVTIQNKVESSRAKALFKEMDDAFEPFEAEATGLLLWRYRGGPWEAAGEFAFSAG